VKKLELIRSLIGPLSDVLGILGFFGISVGSIFTNFINTSRWLMLLIIFFSILLTKLLIEKIFDLVITYKKIIVKQDLEKVTSITNINSISKILPSAFTLNFMFNSVISRAGMWAKDAVVDNICLYIDYRNSWKIPQLQTYFHSNWKHEIGAFYEGLFKSENFEDMSSSIQKHSNDPTPFFKINSNWQEEIDKAFNSVSSRVGNNFSMQIHQSFKYRYNHITITYNEGRVKKSKKFNLNEKFQLI
jgi:hypothetical protein